MRPLQKLFSMRSQSLIQLPAILLLGAFPALASDYEDTFLSQPVRITAGLSKAGEGYFAQDMSRICYQGIPTDKQFYQIFIQPFASSNPRILEPVRISTGKGRTTCAWFSPNGKQLLFASSHLDPNVDRTEENARAQAKADALAGRRRRYQWDFDPHMDLFVADLTTPSPLKQLTDTPGYDAECSFSPDGTQLLFVSDRDGDPDIYVADADGSHVKQLTNHPGYDGGPFFSPDGQWIAYRTDRQEKDLLQIHVMRADGTNDVAITKGRSVHWAPYWHPTKPWLIWTGADHSDPTVRPNYDLWLVQYETDQMSIECGSPLRITDHPGADVLPVFSPDGKLIMWTASRDAEAGRKPTSQLYVSTIKTDSIEAALRTTTNSLTEP